MEIRRAKPAASAVVMAGGIILIAMTCLVSLPMTITTIRSHGGEWGFEMIGLAVLMPLCSYIFFGVAGLTVSAGLRRNIFLSAQILSVAMGILYCIIFPVYPALVVIIPVTLAAAGIADKRNSDYYLMFMEVVGIAANVTLLVWEIQDGHALPLLQLWTN